MLLRTINTFHFAVSIKLFSPVAVPGGGGGGGEGGCQGCWYLSVRHPAREKLNCISKNGGTSAVSLVTGLRTCLDR